jgi:hypothetical protein
MAKQTHYQIGYTTYDSEGKSNVEATKTTDKSVVMHYVKKFMEQKEANLTLDSVTI